MRQVDTTRRSETVRDLVTDPLELRVPSPTAMSLTSTIVIPAYNAGSCLGQTLDSVGAQTMAPHEVIVVDDGSQDDTVAIAAGHPAVTRVIERENGGVCASRNDAIEIATGDLVMTLDADDLWHPEYVERMSRLMASHPDASSGFARWRGWLHPVEEPEPFEDAIDDATRVHDFAGYHEAMLAGLPVLPSFHVARREALERIGSRPYLEHQNFGEAAYLCGLLAAMGPVAEHVFPLGRYRLHANALTADELESARRVAPCVEDLLQVIASRPELGIDPETRRLVDRHAGAWFRRCGRRLGGGGHKDEGRRLLARAAGLGDRRAIAMLLASWLPGLNRRVWVSGWRPDAVQRESGTEAWTAETSTGPRP